MGSSEIATLLERGGVLMREHKWERALDAYGQAASTDEHAVPAWAGLAIAAMCLPDFDRARAAMERVFSEAQRGGDWQTASTAAMQLAMFHESYRGESAIANGWFERARTLLRDKEPGEEHAWLALWQAQVAIHVHGDIPEGQRLLAQARRLNAACGAGELDLLARGLSGLVAISAGAIGDGLRQLDEVAATAMSELPSPQSVGWACCYVLDACERVRDYDRALQWIDRGSAAGRDMAVPHFITFCRSHYFSVLIGRGEYDAAERAIDAIRPTLRSIAPRYHAHCEIRLAELRRRQGRLDEADALLEPHRGQPLAVLTLAALALDRGQAQLALDLAERYLRRVSPCDRVRRLHGLDPLVRALVRLGQDRAARVAIDEVRELASDTAVPFMAALVSDLEGIAARARGDFDEARQRLEDAADAYAVNSAPYEAAVARVALGAMLRELGHDETADAALGAARRAAERLGARLLVEQVDRLRGTPGAPAGDLSTRELQVLALVARGSNNQEIGERLCISAFTVKRHIANILSKLEQPSRAAAAAYAIREGLL